MKIPMIMFEEDGGAASAVAEVEERGTGLANLIISPEVLNPPPASKTTDNPEPPKVDKPLSPKTHEKFAALENAKKRAEQERDEARKAWEEEKAKWEEEKKSLSTPKLPEEVDQELKRLREENASFDSDFKTAIVGRKLRAQYEPTKKAKLEAMTGILTASDADPRIAKALKDWDYNTLAEFGEDQNLTPAQRRDWNRHLEDVARIEDEISHASQNAEQTWQQIEEKEKLQAVERRRVVLEKASSEANEVFSELRKSIPALETAPDLSAEIHETLIALSGGKGAEKYTTRQILQEVAEARVLMRLSQTQAAKIKELDSKLKEQEETIARILGKRPTDNGHYTPDNESDDEVGTGAFRTGGIVVRI